MALDRVNPIKDLPLKPSLTSNRPTQAAITPRLAKSNTTTSRLVGKTSPSALRGPSANVTLRAKHDVSTNSSYGAKSTTSTPTHTRHTPGGSTISLPAYSTTASRSRSPVISSLQSSTSDSTKNVQRARYAPDAPQKFYTGRPRSTVSGVGEGLRSSPKPPSDEAASRLFFRANDAKRQEMTSKKLEENKQPSFFYADGQKEQAPANTLNTQTTVTKEQRNELGRLLSAESVPTLAKVGSKDATQTPNFPSYFPSQSAAFALSRSPSPSKENIHLSYRKGASQIFGTRPLPKSIPSASDLHSFVSAVSSQPHIRLESEHSVGKHHKSNSHSSIDSTRSVPSPHQTNHDLGNSSGTIATPPSGEGVPVAGHSTRNLIREPMPSIETFLEPSDNAGVPPEPLSPSKGGNDLAAEARRERKVLDLEISNNSLLAINSSLERELRRQKAELKRFRRLTRAGRFSFAMNDHSARAAGHLAVLDEIESESRPTTPDADYIDFNDDLSEDESESVASGEPFSAENGESRERRRLSKDDRRLQIDLQRHREILVQSQMMNQCIRRCTYAAEEMITSGKKALEYRVRVSDVRLGGRILTGHEDEDLDETSLIIHDEGNEGTHQYGQSLETGSLASQVAEDVDRANANVNADEDATEIEHAHDLLQVWRNVGRPSVESSEGGDRDSGIEIDKLVLSSS